MGKARFWILWAMYALCSAIAVAESTPSAFNRLYISTDKAQYFGGDTIWLRVLSADAKSGQPVTESKYVYVELVNPFGETVEKVKIIKRDGAYCGYLPLDSKIAEGDYSIAAYTLFMNNVGSGNFAYRSIRVLSPLRFGYYLKTTITDDGKSFMLDIATSNTSKKHKLLVSCGDKKLHIDDSFQAAKSIKLSKRHLASEYLLVGIDNYERFIRWSPVSQQAQADEKPQPAAQTFAPAVSVSKTAFDSREKVAVNISVPEGMAADGGLIVSVTDNSQVAPETSTLGEWVGSHAQTEQNMQNQLEGLEEYPYALEIGQEISGRITVNYTKRPAKHTTVAMISPEQDFMQIVKTDDKGQFAFHGFDFPEDTHFVIQTGESTHRVRIEDPETARCPFQAPRAYTTDEATDSIADKERTRIMSDSNLREIILQEVTVRARKMTPREVIKMWAAASFEYDYFEKNLIISIEEVLRNIPGIRFESGFTHNDDVALYRNKPIAYMIDGTIVHSISNEANVTIGDINAMLDFHSIKYIDFFQPHHAVVYGVNATGGGLLKIVTGMTKGSVDELPNVQHHLPLGYQLPKAFNAPGHPAAAGSHADMRSTVYWNPQLTTDSNGKAAFTFDTTDNPSANYTIRIEGLTANGQPISYSRVVTAD